MVVKVKSEFQLAAASYERVSSDEQAREGFSLEVQGEKNIKHINDQGWTLYDRYIDAGKSAKNLKRPDMQRLLSDIDAGKIKVVVVHKLDRLTRNIGDLHELLLLFERKDIKLVSINENIDTSSAMGRMFVYMLGIFAQWYRENLSEEVIKGQRKRAESGLRNTSSAPYGYNVNPEDLSLTINEEEAAVVRRIFRDFLNGGGKIGISAKLTKEGIPAPGGGIWYESTIGTIVVNPTYVGSIHWKPRKESDEERVIVENVHEPIIDRDTWEEAQRIAARRRDGWMNTSSYDFPFSTVVKCGECGRSYHGKMTHRKNDKWNKANYRCSGKYRAVKCNASDIYEPVMERLFLSYLESFDFKLDNPDKVVSTKDVGKEIKRLKKLLSESEAKRKNYARAMGNGKLDYDMFEELVDEELKKSEEWKSDLDKLQESMPQSSARTRKDVSQQIKVLKEEWYELDRDQRKISLARIFDVLIIKKIDGEWKITGYKLAQ